MNRILLVLFACFGLCCRPVPPRFKPRPFCTYSKLPLKVDLAPSLAWQRPALNRAFDKWSAALGFDVFDWVWDYDEADIVFVRGPRPPTAPEALAVTQRSSLSGRCYSVITVLVNMDEAQAELFGTHELGHALGVGHSEAPWSVMRPRLDWLRLDEYVVRDEDRDQALKAIGSRE